MSKEEIIEQLRNQNAELRDELDVMNKEIEELKKDNSKQWAERCRMAIKLDEEKQTITADERFKELGYKKTVMLNKYNDVCGAYYINSEQLITIIFDYEKQMVCTSCIDTGEPVYIKMNELETINTRCKELGWI